MTSIRDYDGIEGHWLDVRRRSIGMTATYPARPLYGATGRCSCGWTYKTNEAATRTRKRIVAAHRDHVAEATGKDES